MSKVGKFDLNIEDVLDNWEVYHALREIIANALDEQILSNSAKKIEITNERDVTKIRDFGRGLRYEHLTQKENPEKLNNPAIIGKFGVGLKDALGTLNRHKIDVIVKTKHGDITLERTGKHDFDDIKTLHAILTNPSDSNFLGTEFLLKGCNVEELDKAKNLFLVYSGESAFEKTKYGEILTKKSTIANIYINGVKVAEEENFLFSYNITSMTPTMRKSLNRERTNVGRTAYTERIKSILLTSRDSNVARILGDDLRKWEEGTLHDELKWDNVCVHACEILNSKGNVVFVTPQEQSTEKHLLDYAKGDGKDVIIIPVIIREKIHGIKDIDGNVMIDVSQYQHEYNESFVFEFISESELTREEKEVFSCKDKIMKLVGGKPKVVREIKISETLREGSAVCGVEGLWQPKDGVIVIKRDLLSNLNSFAGTLLHEIAHAKSGYPDVDQNFESTLSEFLGEISSKAIKV
ncbi:MAG: ATP-binding protein [Crenarchaeota archaeon]|nr:ATP-binding protein [Thermoproteota archaeon]